MKKVMTILTMLLLVSINLSASNFQQQIELTYERGPEYNRPHDRSLQMDIEAFLNVPYLVFRSYMTEEQGANIYIVHDDGDVVMSETLLLSPYSETPLYIGDLSDGTYKLVIELQDAVLYGTFLIFN